MQVGDVVSLRIRTSAGPTEVVGTVLAASPEALTLRRRDGAVVDVDVTQITAGRVVPPSPAQTIDPAELHWIMTSGWRALETEALGGWLLRAAGGFTGRANSALPVGDPGLPLETAIDRIEQWYGERDLPPRVQLPDRVAPTGLPTQLEARGWQSAWPTHVMTAELAGVLRGSERAGEQVRIDAAPDDAWLAAYRPDEGRTALPDALVRHVLANHPDAAFVSVREGEECVAIARVSVDGRWAGLFCVEVRPGRRRSGLATAVSRAALRWAVARGARRAYLQVTVDNTPACALYERLGFTVHHDYRYWSGR